MWSENTWWIQAWSSALPVCRPEEFPTPVTVVQTSTSKWNIVYKPSQLKISSGQLHDKIVLYLFSKAPMLTDGSGWQLCCVMVCIWVRFESVGVVCLDSPNQASEAGQSCGQAGTQPTNQHWAFIKSYNFVVGFHRHWKMWLRYGVVVVVM